MLVIVYADDEQEHSAVLDTDTRSVDIYRGHEWAATGYLSDSGRIEDCPYEMDEDLY